MITKTPKLLVVDDEIDQVESIKNYFSKRGFEVFSAATGEEALAGIKENKPDIVLLDMRLSGSMEGKDVLRILRQHDKQTKVVFITGDILTYKEIKQITNLGIVELLSKPVIFSTLESVIKKVLKNKYPKAVVHIKPAGEVSDDSLRSISHDLSNIASDITSKCELYILDTEQGLNQTKSEKERLNEAIQIIKSVLKSTERLSEIIKRISAAAKK